MMEGRIIAGRYTMGAMIGEGGMSRVYKAHDMNTGKPVAVKVLREEYKEDEVFVRRFEREAQAASRMSHPNIANLLDVGREEDGMHYLVIEYVQGKTLKQYIQENGAIRPEMAAQVIIRVLAALSHAHQNGVIHRDIKPQNILIDKEGAVKVSDFGIARVANTQTMSQDSDIVMGSVYYFSPEQAKGAEVDEKSDIYSVGVMFYEMLTGRVPFTGDTPVAIAMKHLREPPVPPSEVNPGVSKAMEYVVMQALAKRPKARYATAADMLRDVRLALDNPNTILAARAEMERREREARAVSRREGRTQKRVRLMRRMLMAVFSLLLLVVIVLSVSAITGQVLKARRSRIEMPNVVGMKSDKGIDTLTTLGLKLAVDYDVYPLVKEGLIANQSVMPGEMVLVDEVVTIVVSRSEYDLRLSNYTGMSVDKAHASLSELGLIAANSYVVSDATAEMVIGQEPEAGALMRKGDTVTLTVSAGAVSMPTLTGLTLYEVEQTVPAYTLVLNVNERPVDDPAKVGLVISQLPEAYTRVRPNSTVQVTIGTPSDTLYTADVILRLEGLRKGGTLTVTVDDEDGAEQQQRSEAFPDGGDAWPITLYSRTARQTQYHVYFDGELAYSENLVFRP